MSGQNNTKTILLAILLVAVIAGALIYTRATREPEPAPAAQPATPEPTEAPEIAIQPLPAEQAPRALAALGYMPEQAQFAIGIPPVNSIVEQVLPLAQRALKDDLDLQQEMDSIADDLAAEMDVSPEGGLPGVLKAMGIDTDRGAAVFFDLQEALQEGFAAVEASPGHIPALPDLSAAKTVVAVPALDPATVVASLRKIGGDLLSGMQEKSEEVDGVTLVSYEGVGGYFTTDDAVVLGNDLDMLKAAAARVANPAVFTYGSQACPPDDVNEASALIFPEKLLPILEKAAGILAETEPAARALIETKMESMKKMFEESGAQESLLITLNANSKHIELKSRVDTAVYPGITASMGEAKPLRWAPLLPTNTLVLLSLAFSPEFKKQITDVYMNAVPDEARANPMVDQVLTYGRQGIELLGSELTVGITGLDPLDFPSLYVIADLSNPMGAQMLLQIAPQTGHGDPYQGVQIKALALPSPVPVYFAIVDTALVLTNNDEGLKALIDLVKAGTTSGFFESLDPPLDPATPIYQALMVRPEVYTDIIEPIASLAGYDLSPEIGDIMAELKALFKDVRLMGEMQGNWLVSRIQAVVSNN